MGLVCFCFGSVVIFFFTLLTYAWRGTLLAKSAVVFAAGLGPYFVIAKVDAERIRDQWLIMMVSP